MIAPVLAFFVPTEAARGALQVDLVFWALVVFALAFSLAIVGLIVVFAIRYRAGAKVNREKHLGNTMRYEAIWIVIPAIIGLGLFAWAAHIYLDEGRPPSDALTVYVVGKQWMWKVQHPEGRREINELHLPLGRPVKLVMTSQDVIHSFFVPAFRLKQDLLPKRYTTLWFTPSKEGNFHLFCAEYCGTGHSTMRGRVVVMKPDAYDAWLGAGSETAPAPGTPGMPGAALSVRGRDAFYRYGCNSCHLPNDAVRAPRLDGLWDRPIRLANGDSLRFDEQYVRESILDPQAKIAAGYAEPSLMPTYRGQVTQDDLNNLVEFIRSLRNGWPAAADTVAASTQEAGE